VALRIEDYALIGDCKTAALVGRRARVSSCPSPGVTRRRKRRRAASCCAGVSLL
jgi:hypothetical protein